MQSKPNSVGPLCGYKLRAAAIKQCVVITIQFCSQSPCAYVLAACRWQAPPRRIVATPVPLATLASPAVAGDARTLARQGMTAFEKGRRRRVHQAF